MFGSSLALAAGRSNASSSVSTSISISNLPYTHKEQGGIENASCVFHENGNRYIDQVHKYIHVSIVPSYRSTYS